MNQVHRVKRIGIVVLAVAALQFVALAEGIRVGTFDIDATPPIGSPLAYDPMTRVDKPLRCRGLVILSDQAPIALVSLDWIGIGNGGHDEFRRVIAEALGTTADRIAVHTVHQHDAPVCDFTADELLAEHRLSGVMFNVEHARSVIVAAAEAAKVAAEGARSVTHVGSAEAVVHDVASNRRILGPDGKVRASRWTATKEADLRALPEGTIDPMLRLIGFFEGDKPLAVMTFFATHPQSYYRTGAASPDFPGLARDERDAALGGPIHVHFAGAGGNIGAGKFNDGSPENRPVLAGRLADGMARAYEGALSARRPVTTDDLGWAVERVVLPPAESLNVRALEAKVADGSAVIAERTSAAATVAFLRRVSGGHRYEIGCLRLGGTRALFLPGELLVEYQLAAAALRPDAMVAVAAYGDYGPGYIAMAHHYRQGGYEATVPASRVSPRVQSVLMNAVERLLAE